MTIKSNWKRAGFPIVLSIGFALGGVPTAQEHPLKEFEPWRDYIVEVDGSRDKRAQVYRSRQPVAIMVIEPRLPNPLILTPGSYAVESLTGDVTVRQDGRATVTSGYKTAPAGKFVVNKDQSVVFRFEGRDVRLSPRPHMHGWVTSKQIEEYDSQYTRLADTYEIDSARVKECSNTEQAKVTVYFGSWCPHCQRYIPHFIRTERELGSSGVDFEYYAVKKGGDDEATRAKIQYFPTAIVTVGGKEVGRIEGHDVERPEIRLSAILAESKN